MTATTYIDLDGRVVGIAVAAPAHHTDLATRTVATWSRTLRTRRVLVPLGDLPCGPPPATEPALPGPRPGPLHPLSEHLDCPRRARTRAVLGSYLDRGDTVLLLGSEAEQEHHWRERAGLGSADVISVPDPVSAGKVTVPAPERLSFVIGSCARLDDVPALLRILRRRFPMLRGQHPDLWCYAASDLLRMARTVADRSDLTLLLGPTAHFGAPSDRRAVRRIDTLGDLSPSDVADAATIAVIGAGTSAESSDTAVITALSGLGPLSVVHHRALSAVVTDIDKAAPPTAAADRIAGQGR
ncbi:hypothetical protein [Kitasatospora putterlickiae]|uniref:hypothetical protein n=1 Tax=Kitasatospora putterlickiae TaxID=221725 RepID=UPI0031D5A79E